MTDARRPSRQPDHSEGGRRRPGRRTATITMALALTMALPLAVIASHQFSDVPDSNIFHEDIEWLADNDVTRGCNPPENTEFCPDDNVTRQQMAAFMHRLATNQVVDAATAETADSAQSAQTAEEAEALQGFGVADIAPRAAFDSAQIFGGGASSLSVDIEAPAAGILVINASVDVFMPGTGTVDVQCDLSLDGTTIPGSLMGVTVSDVDDMRDGICSTTGAIQVDTGEHTVLFDIRDFVNASLLNGSLNAVWVPFDGSGVTP